MQTKLYTIDDRVRTHPAEIARPAHLMLKDGQSTTPQLLIDEPGWSPYCIDDANRQVLFVYTPPEVDFAQAAFMYTAQFERGQRVLAVPYEALAQLTDDMKACDSIIFVHSIGRCGSTLMSKVLGQIEGVYSLSEPDIYTNLSYLRMAYPDRQDELKQVVKSCTLLLCKTQNSVTAIKPRSHGLALSDWLTDSFPNIRNIFMYRNAVTWAQSLTRFAQRLGFPNLLPRDEALSLWTGLTTIDVSYLEPYLQDTTELLYFSDFMAPLWTSYIELYMRKYEQGVPFFALRYENLNDRREETLRAALEYCGLPTVKLEQAMASFERDSQAGSAIARDIQADGLSPERIEAFLNLLSRHPRYNHPDFILPSMNTLT